VSRQRASPEIRCDLVRAFAKGELPGAAINVIEWALQALIMPEHQPIIAERDPKVQKLGVQRAIGDLGGIDVTVLQM
jgi:hypothetical protein